VIAAATATVVDRSVRRELQQLGGAMVVSMALGLTGRLLIPRMLGPSAFGAYRFAEASADVVLVLLSLGLDALLRRDIARTPAVCAAHLWPVLALRAALGVVVMGSGLMVLALTDTSSDVLVLFGILGIGQVCAALTNAAQAAQQALGRGAHVARSMVGIKALWFVALVLALLPQPGALQVAIISAGIEVGRMVVLLAALAREMPPQRSAERAAVWRLVGDAWPFAVNALAHSVYARLGVWRLGQTSAESEVGLYAAASQVGAVALAGIPLLFAVLLPAASRDTAQADRLYASALRIVLVVFAPLGALITLAAPFWSHLLLGDAYRPALAALYWQAPTVLLTYIASISAMALLTRGDAMQVANISIAGALVGLVANVALIPVLPLAARPAAGRGAAGAAVAGMLTELFVASLLLQAAWRSDWTTAMRAPWRERRTYAAVR
jgi:O-antigen/teichoic acid export membrane protein